MTRLIERHARDDYKVKFLNRYQFVSLRFQYTKESRSQISWRQDFYELKSIVLDSRISQSLASIKSSLKDSIRQHLIMNGAV